MTTLNPQRIERDIPVFDRIIDSILDNPQFQLDVRNGKAHVTNEDRRAAAIDCNAKLATELAYTANFGE